MRPAITNEAHLPPMLNNSIGTLSMALVGRNTNSATSSWFFNALDNSLNLDSQAFTVFGHVVAGLTNLYLFNSPGIEIVDLGPPFSELPVPNTSAPIPRYSDLYTVQITVVRGPDVIKPTVAIASPAANARLATNFVTVQGTANDMGGVREVRYAINGETDLLATGSNSWSAGINLRAGTNTFVVQSVDTYGNYSLPQQRIFVHVVSNALTRQIVGSGTITGPANGQMLEIGRGYTLVAKPAAGHLFAGWTGDRTSTNPTLNFVMQTNFSVTAHFIPNPFIPLKGMFNGLFSEETGIRQESAGGLNLSLLDSGKFSGALLQGGKRTAFSGQFNLSGLATAFIRNGTNTNRVELSLDLTNATQSITGRVVTAGWTSSLRADRASFSARNPSPQVGKYTTVFFADRESENSPNGNGSSAITVDVSGNASFTSAKLGDGTPLTLRVPLAQDGRLPVYQSLYGGKGLLHGWLQFTNDINSDLQGSLSWIKPAGVLTSKLYPAGFTNRIDAHGSVYVQTNAALPGTSAIVQFDGGNLPSSFHIELILGPNNKITPTNSANRLTLTIAKPTGLFSGTVVPPGATRPITFSGAILQRIGEGYGLSLGTNASACVFLGSPQ